MPVLEERRESLTSLSLFVVASSAYLAFLTAHYSYDSVAAGILLYQWLSSGRVEQLFHRYHVLYLPLAAGVELSLGRMGVEVDPLTLLQMMNAVFAAASVAVYHRLARAMELDRVTSVLLAVLFGGGFASWYYATNGESYPISIFFLLLAFLSAARAPEAASWARGCMPGVWLGLAAAFHGTALLALPGLAVLTWQRGAAIREPGGGRIARGSLSPVAAMTVAAALVLGLPYGVRYLLVQRIDPVSGLGADASAFASEEGWSMRPRLIDDWRGLADAMVPTDWPALPPSAPVLARAVNLALLALTLLPLALLSRRLRGRPRGSPPGREPVLAVAVWLAVSFLFFSTYYAGSPKFASYQWAPLLLLVGFAGRRIATLLADSSPLSEATGNGTRIPVARLAATAILFLVVAATLACTLDLARRQTDPDSNPHLSRARAIARLTQPDDLVVHTGRGENQYQSVYTPYFAVRRSLVLDQLLGASPAGEGMRTLRSRMTSAAAGPGRIVVLSDAVEPGDSSRELERARGIPEGSLARFFAARGPRLLAEDPSAGKVWVLTAPESPELGASPPPTADR